MARKKFFYNKVYNTKRTIINCVIIGACIIGIIICFIVTSNFEGENLNKVTNVNVDIKKEVSVEVNEEFSEEIFFNELDGITTEELDIEYPDDYDISKTGTYKIKITVATSKGDEEFTLILNIIDTTKPLLVLGPVSIEEGKEYTANDFVISCSDNSGEECIINFYQDAMDEDGNTIDYSSYTKTGTYSIKIAASDSSGNQTISETTLTIGESEENGGEDETVSCKYGDNEYDTDEYLLTVDVTNSGCALSLDLYKSDTVTAGINEIMETETTKIKNEIEALNLKGTLALNRQVTVVINTDGTGIVGYELKMTVTVTNDDDVETIVEYKVNSEGNRVYTINTYNLD